MFKSIPIWQQNHLRECLKENLFQGKRVLEVGGETPDDIVKSLGVLSWTSVDPSFSTNQSLSETHSRLSLKIQDLKTKEPFDFIIATNSFEHIHSLKEGMDKMYELLEQGGKLSALMGPIWSCHKGSHVWCNADDGSIIDFNNLKAPNWAHLLYTKEEMKKHFLQNYSDNETEKILNCFYDWDYLNHLFYDDYLEIINQSNFTIKEIKDWHTSVYPDTETQNILSKKYNKKNFSTVSIKILLEKP